MKKPIIRFLGATFGFCSAIFQLKVGKANFKVGVSKIKVGNSNFKQLLKNWI